jgi:exoribonuclease R
VKAPVPGVVLRGSAPALDARFDAVRERLELPQAFPPEVVEAPRAAAAVGPRAVERRDLRDVPFVTVDPRGSRDLDQALHLERRGDGFRIRYAIADVGAWVARGDALDAEAWQRGQTFYAPDRRTPLYPPELSEGAASLLPDGDRPAVVLELDLDAHGTRTAFRSYRALVRSRRQLAYDEVGPDVVPLLDVVGPLLGERAAERGANELDAPAQVVVPDDGPAGYRLEWEERLPSEAWNAQISLAANAAVGDELGRRGTGVLRTMPPPRPQALRALHATARALGGASYRVLQGAPTADDEHAAVGGLYAHATAPLRRLADRYLLEELVGDPVDAETFGRLAHVMETSDALAARYEHAIVDLVESRLLEGREGEVFDACVLSVGGPLRIQIASPPIVANLPEGHGLEPGDAVRVRLAQVDVDEGRLHFQPA